MSGMRYGARIGVIGADIAGLHLGLRLRQLGIDSTIITDNTPDQVAAGRLANSVVHWPATLRRERVLKVYHWPAEEFGFAGVRQVIQTPEPIEISGRASAPARAVDYRIYLPRLMEDFVQRGGRLELSSLHVNDISVVAERFDLVVITTAKNGFDRLFARDALNSPYDRPQRSLLAGLFTGLHPTQPRGANLSVAPGRGEAVEFPILSRTGMVSALAVSTVQANELALLRRPSSRVDRTGFRTALLSELERHHPTIYDRIDCARFDLQGPDDLLQTAITPVVRHPIAHLGDGKYTIALGDVHVTMDPMVAQGANMGSYSAFVLAEAIAEADAFDLAFCREAERSRAARVLAASHWTNAFLQPSDEARTELLVALSSNRRLADEYIDDFDRTERQWEQVRSPERIRAWLREKQLPAMHLAGITAEQ